MSAMRTLSSRIFRLRSKRRKRPNSPWLLSAPDSARLSETLANPQFLAVHQQLIEILEEQEVGALVGAETPQDVSNALARLRLLEQLYIMPERLAQLNKEHYDRAKRESGDAPDPAKYHLGSPFFWNTRR
jgi:hypothetical protein